MKKLMVAVAVVAMAVASQAAAFNWSDEGVKDILGENLYSGAFTMYYTVKGEDAWAQYASASGSLSGGAFDITLDNAPSLVGGTTYSFYYTATDVDGNVYTSEIKNGKANTSDQIRYVTFAAGGSWESVPEPTSGLLLLLGVAGLALRRRRA